MRLIGITGGIGSGKSELLEFIRKHYRCEIYLADEVAHAVKEPGQPCYEQLVALLGQDILKKDGYIDKAAMAAKIFADKLLLNRVNELIHPAVRVFLLDKIERARQNAEVELFFIEAALLIEAGYQEMVDELWYIYSEEAIRRQRLEKSRGYTAEKITQIMEQQLSEEAFRAACDFEIDNSGSLEESYCQIKQKLEAYTWQD